MSSQVLILPREYLRKPVPLPHQSKYKTEKKKTDLCLLVDTDQAQWAPRHPVAAYKASDVVMGRPK